LAVIQTIYKKMGDKSGEPDEAGYSDKICEYIQGREIQKKAVMIKYHVYKQLKILCILKTCF